VTREYFRIRHCVTTKQFTIRKLENYSKKYKNQKNEYDTENLDGYNESKIQKYNTGAYSFPNEFKMIVKVNQIIN
jgi:hypothetical protein